jgi:hypothetical protein
MGYTHYWYRPRKIDQAKMSAIAGDFARLVIALDDIGVRLADGHGEGVPTITPELVCFNGVANCGHAKNENVSIPWPDKRAAGVNDTEQPISGRWFAGALLSTRTCNGDCSYETFYFPAEMPADTYWQPNSERKDLYFSCTKTAFRPYDLAVTAFLIIAKRYLGDDIKVSSDGEDENWQEAKQVCEAFLDYGLKFQLAEELVEVTP